MGRPENAVDCWLLNEEELGRWLCEKQPFNPPNLFAYAYFLRIRKPGDDIIEGYLGRRDMSESYHTQITSQYDYFNKYRDRKRIGVTFDKVICYEITEIFTSTPLLFTIKKIRQPEIVLNNNTTKIDGLPVSKMVHPIHFEDYSGIQFERLVFAYVLRMEDWDIIEWLGQTGDDDGRDIWGSKNDISYCYQCANYGKSVPFKKVTDDIDKLVKKRLIPDYFIVICGGRVSASIRTAIKNYAGQYGIKETRVWSGAEFEERLRKDVPALVERFVEGIEFP